jgi:putative glutamine amidotransferase
MAVVVAVTCDRRGEGPVPLPVPGRVRPPRPEVYVNVAVVDAVRAAGGEPVLLPPDGDVVDFAVERCDAVVISGGAFDIHPRHYGEPVMARLDRTDDGRTSMELALARACIDHDVPVLGVCGGAQALAVAAGGRLWQDILDQVSGATEHEQPTDPATPWHPVRLQPGLLRDLYGADTIEVNSTHHQAVCDPGPLRVAGIAPDGVIEAIVHPARRFCVGVQWHPELIDPAPYRALVTAAKR